MDKKLELDTSVMETPGFAAEGLKWLYEMKALSSPVLLDNLYGNIYSNDPSIKETELLIDKQNSKMLIWIKLGWWANLTRKKKIVKNILDGLQGVLPSFDFRIILDRELFNLALKRVEDKTFGVKDENDTKTDDDAVDDTNNINDIVESGKSETDD